MKIVIETNKELDLEQEQRLVNYIYFKLLDDFVLNKFSVKSDNFTKEVKK